jgi:RNA polymerase sigma-70 factor (ECF subfamily)
VINKIEGKRVNAREDLKLWTPKLRRYAHALLGPSLSANPAADDLVHSTLHRTLKMGAAAFGSDLGFQLYRLLTELHRDNLRASEYLASQPPGGTPIYAESPLRHGNAGQSSGAVDKIVCFEPQRDRLLDALRSLKLDEKEAYLLVVLEEMSYARAARILRISKTALVARLMRARAALSAVDICPPKPKSHRPSYLHVVK